MTRNLLKEIKMGIKKNWYMISLICSKYQDMKLEVDEAVNFTNKKF